MGAYFAFTSYVKDFPGGPEAFVDAAMQSSPSYARYMNSLPYPPGSADWYAKGDSADAFLAIEGKRSGIYDPTTLPDKGTIPNQPPGMTVAMKRALEDNADAAAGATGSGSGNDYTDFVADVQSNVDKLYNAQQLVDAWFPGAGYVAGVTYFDYDTYKAMQAAGYSPPKKGDIAYEYNDWLLSNPVSTDLSVEAFLDQREQSAGGGGATSAVENVTPEMILAQRNASVDVVPTDVPRTATGAMDTSGLQPVAVNAQGAGLPLYATPSWNAATPIVLPLDARLSLVRLSADGTWAEVVTADGEVGWLPSAGLNTA
jgi:hypothetical protein